MKKIVLLLLISSVAFSQNVTKKETIKTFLFKTWIADYGMMNGLKIERLGPMKQLEYNFRADNTYTVNKNKTGQWKYNEKTKSIELYQNGKLMSTITSLKNKSLAMTLNPDKPASKDVKNLEIFFKPKA